MASGLDTSGRAKLRMRSSSSSAESHSTRCVAFLDGSAGNNAQRPVVAPCSTRRRKLRRSQTAATVADNGPARPRVLDETRSRSSGF